LNPLAQSSFPLCMQEMHNRLLTDHKLMHDGRMQFGLFLKGIGFSLEDSLQIWQREFTKRISVDEFNKSYAYNIRHSYGQEGKRTDYTPYSCTKMLAIPFVQDKEKIHGCPYKDTDMLRLRSKLARTLGPNSPAIDNIIEKVKNKEYQVACKLQFEARYPGCLSGNVGNHPNAYVLEAHKFLKGKQAKTDEASTGSDASNASLNTSIDSSASVAPANVSPPVLETPAA